MKIAIVQEHVDPERGGAETSAVEMARHLAHLNHHVTILHAANIAIRGFPDPVHDTASRLRFQAIPSPGMTKALRTFRFVRRVQRVCYALDFDIVHAITPCLSANVYQPRGGTYRETIARTLAIHERTLRYPLKLLGRKLNIRQQFLLRIEEALLTRRQQRVRVAALSDYVRRQITEGYGFPDERTHTIFNGVEPPIVDPAQYDTLRRDQRREHDIPDDARLILFIGHNFKLKGLATLLAALRRLHSAAPRSAWLCVVLGRDNPRRYRSAAQSAGLAEHVRFLGPAMSVERWYAAADVLAHPTWYDPCSRVVLEALTAGLPVVTTRYNGAAEVIQPGRHGEVIDEPSDAEALAEALERSLQAEVRQACRADAPRLRDRLSMARHAEQLIEFYAMVRRS